MGFTHSETSRRVVFFSTVSRWFHSVLVLWLVCPDSRAKAILALTQIWDTFLHISTWPFVISQERVEAR